MMRPSLNPFLARIISGAAVLVGTSSCSGPSGNGVFTLTQPSYATFRNEGNASVGDVFAANCGTLDCHGSIARNMRVYSEDGLRLASDDVPHQKDVTTGEFGTTEAEYAATYESIIAIEPERLSQIVQNGGAGSDSWLVLGKGRGAESHKGGKRLVKGGPADTCIVLWISGAPVTYQPFQDACTNGSVVSPPTPGGMW